MSEYLESIEGLKTHYRTMKDELHGTNYLRKQRMLSDMIGKEETKTIWFRREDIQSFFSGVLGDPDISGIRAYLCSYGSEEIDTPYGPLPHDEDFLKQICIAFVATRTDGDREVDYVLSNKTGAMLAVLPPLNHGELCPRKCND